MNSTIIHHDLGSLLVLEKENLCRIIDRGDQWKQLGLLMQFDGSVLEVRNISQLSHLMMNQNSVINYFYFQNIQAESFRSKKSPTDILLRKWTIYGHKVTELFKLLAGEIELNFNLAN